MKQNVPNVNRAAVGGRVAFSAIKVRSNSLIDNSPPKLREMKNTCLTVELADYGSPIGAKRIL